MVEEVVNLAASVDGWLYLIVFLIVMLECQPLLGLFMPGETLVLVTGFLAGQDVLDLRLLIPIVGFAAVIGDTIGFELGHRLGRGWLLRYGGKSVFLSHFMHFLRALMPFTAGAGQMRYRRFALYNTIGCFLWATIFSLLGYFFGESWDTIHRWTGGAGILLVLLVLVVFIAVWSWQWRARDDSRA